MAFGGSSTAPRREAAGRPRLLQAGIEAFGQADVRAKILFTLGMLIVFRFVAHIPVPGVDGAQLQQTFDQNAVLGFLNIFSGGALENLSVAALGVRLEGLTIAVLDLSDISNRLVGRPVHFIMGRELFDRERLAIDIEEGRIEVISREPTPAGVELKVTNLQGLATVKARVNGVEADADFDLGNGSGVLIGKAFAEELGLLNELSALERRKGGGVGGEVERAIVRLATLEIAGETFHDFEAAVDETDSAGALNVGVGLLRKFRITTDFSESRLWLDPR